MPSIANIVVKKNDGTTDITYTAVVPSSGDTVFAVWKSQTVGVAPGHQPEFKLASREASNGQKRALHSVFNYPQLSTNSQTGVTSVVNRAVVSTDWTIPKDMTVTDINEFVTQYANLLASALIKQCAQAGYSAT